MVKKCDCSAKECSGENSECSCGVDIAAFLSKHGKAIGIASIVAIVCFVGYSLYSFVQHKIESKFSAEYVAVQSTDELINWIKSGVPAGLSDLKGFSALKVANEKYSNNNFEEAASFYLLASEAFKLCNWINVAKIGYANSLIMQGKDAENVLDKLTKTELISLNEEVNYSLGLLALKSGNTAKFNEKLNAIKALAVDGSSLASNLKAIKSTIK